MFVTFRDAQPLGLNDVNLIVIDLISSVDGIAILLVALYHHQKLQPVNMVQTEFSNSIIHQLDG